MVLEVVQTGVQVVSLEDLEVGPVVEVRSWVDPAYAEAAAHPEVADAGA